MPLQEGQKSVPQTVRWIEIEKECSALNAMRAEVTEIADDNMWLEPRIAQVAHILSGRLLSAMM